MTIRSLKSRSDSEPVVAVLVAHWEASSEEGWLTRQVSGALACVADVHIVTPDGSAAATLRDGAFTLHQLGTPLDVKAELRRQLLIDGLSTPGGRDSLPLSPSLSSLLDKDLLTPWLGATAVIDRLRPDLVIVAGHQNVGAMDAIERSSHAGLITLLALGSDTSSLEFSHFKRLFERADSVLAVTETERRAIIESYGRGPEIYRIGAPMAANPSALTEPNGWVGTSDYILLVTGSGSREKHVETELARLVRLSFPNNPVGMVHTDSFCVWHQGHLNEGWAVERSSDMARLLAWARVTVDLRPGPLFARRCVDSLLYGTPIVIPTESRAREHASRGKGGLWFSNPSELIWCIEALLDPPTGEAFGHQGREYAMADYGSTEHFIDRVVTACGLSSEEAVASIAGAL
jgi:hypothetical protein